MGEASSDRGQSWHDPRLPAGQEEETTYQTTSRGE